MNSNVFWTDHNNQEGVFSFLRFTYAYPSTTQHLTLTTTLQHHPTLIALHQKAGGNIPKIQHQTWAAAHYFCSCLTIKGWNTKISVIYHLLKLRSTLCCLIATSALYWQSDLSCSIFPNTLCVRPESPIYSEFIPLSYIQSVFRDLGQDQSAWTFTFTWFCRASFECRRQWTDIL